MGTKNQGVHEADGGWTTYQKLVLNELERHEAKIDILEKELIVQRLLVAKLEVALETCNETIAEMAESLKSLDSTMLAKTAALNSEREKMNQDIGGLKWKVGTIAAGAATLITAAIQIAAKFFLQILG